MRGDGFTLRRWSPEDLEPFAALNADPRVMAHFPSVLTRAESHTAAQRLAERAAEDGFGPLVLDVDGFGFGGIVGLTVPRFELPVLDTGFTPANPTVEILWRLTPSLWGQGYATRAATLVLRDAFEVRRLPEVVTFTTVANLPSQRVMQRLGFVLRGRFEHPKLPAEHSLRTHVFASRRSFDEASAP
jgi:RimJ/RimL family protein N-acetyltransferase